MCNVLVRLKKSRSDESRSDESRRARSRGERGVAERLLSIFVHCHPFFEKCNILVKCHKRCNIQVRLKYYNIFDKGAQLCVIQDRFKNVTYAIIQSDSKIMQYSGRGADDSKYCNIRGRSSRVQCSGQVEEVAKRRVAFILSSFASTLISPRGERCK